MTKYKHQAAKSGECRSIEHNESGSQSYSQFCLRMSKSHCHCSPGLCRKQPARRLQVSLQSTLRVWSSPVTESDVQSQATFALW